tara:strand:- start:6572 stop:7015 length:444 start_codon:yes stop_codon:yes gene_type:complete
MDNLTYDEKKALKTELIKLFEKLSKYKSNNRLETGICIMVESVAYELFYHDVPEIELETKEFAWEILPINFLTASFISWKHYSGDIIYPVPSTKSYKKGYDFYENDHKLAYTRIKKWGNSKYGDLRRDLAKHCFEYFKENFYTEIKV